eukprot:scpid75292/ scgid13345/ 
MAMVDKRNSEFPVGAGLPRAIKEPPMFKPSPLLEKSGKIAVQGTQGRWRTVAQNAAPETQVLSIPQQLERPNVRVNDGVLPSYRMLQQRPVVPATAISNGQSIKMSKFLEEQHGKSLKSLDWKAAVAPAPAAASTFDTMVLEISRRKKRFEGDAAHMNIFENIKGAKPGNPEGCLCDSRAAVQYMRKQQGDAHAKKLKPVDDSAYAAKAGISGTQAHSQEKTSWYRLWKLRSLRKKEKNLELPESPPPGCPKQVYPSAQRPRSSAKKNKTSPAEPENYHQVEAREMRPLRRWSRLLSLHSLDDMKENFHGDAANKPASKGMTPLKVKPAGTENL